jgi:hypothetical protein
MRRMIVCALATGLLLAAGCGSEPEVLAPPRPAPPEPAGPLVLAQFARGVGAVAPGADDPRWSDPAAVAALDGSAVFSVRHEVAGDVLARLDPETGDATSSWPLPNGVSSIHAVSPGGRWVALTDGGPGYSAPPRTSTHLVVFDTVNGAEKRQLDLTGDLRPEAFSVDGQWVFAIDYRGDHYRVQTIVLATGERSDTVGRDKTIEPEDMHGTSVRGVLSADGTLLATLYRNPGDDDEPAFVHVLDLKHGWDYCADLAAPFGTGSEGSDRIVLTARGTVIVAATDANRIAEIHIAEVHHSSRVPVTVEYRDGTIEPEPDLGTAPGHVIAPLR